MHSTTFAVSQFNLSGNRSQMAITPSQTTTATLKAVMEIGKRAVPTPQELQGVIEPSLKKI